MKEYKGRRIAMIARTIGLEYDDRIRKECVTLSSKADITIFVNFADNRKEKGVTSYGVPYIAYRLLTRDYLPSKKFLFIKSLEFYLQIIKHLKDFDIVWTHEIYTYIFPLLGSKGRYIWDQHEIPTLFQKPLLKPFFHYIEKKCIYMIHANKFRINYLYEQGLIKNLKKHKIIRNYPDKRFLQSYSSTNNISYNTFNEWLNGDKYVYQQGLTLRRRYPFNTVESILQETNLKIVIIGGFEESAKKKLIDKYGNLISERVYFMGMVNQLDIPMYIKKAQFSIVLYDTLTANNKFCEPNRMYQAISLGVPVIVGCNEPMKEIVENFQFGISLNHDGNNLDDLKLNIKKMQVEIDGFKEMIEINKSYILWENQESKILDLIN
jgi:hypothetical protein